MNQVRTKVNQYEIRQETSMSRSGSQMPLDFSFSPRALEARSTGTRRTMLAGRARARKMETIRYAGAVLKDRKWCNSRNTRRETSRRARMAATPDSLVEVIVTAIQGGEVRRR